MNNEHNKQMHIADKVLAYIEKENVQPYSKWYFTFTNDFFWALGALSVLIGSICFSAVLFTYFNAELELYRLNYDSFFDFLLEWAPILWIVSFTLFMYVGYKNIQHTKHGYKYSFLFIILSSLFLSGVGGIFLYSYGLAGILDREFDRRVPLYRSVQGLKKDLALRPERGGIGGEIIFVPDDLSSFTVRDFKGGTWVVSTEELTLQDWNVISDFSLVRVIGIPSTTTIDGMSTSTMHGCAVLPWKIEQSGDGAASSSESFRVIKNSMLERKENIERSNVCKDIQPYLIIQDIRNRIHK